MEDADLLKEGNDRLRKGLATLEECYEDKHHERGRLSEEKQQCNEGKLRESAR